MVTGISQKSYKASFPLWSLKKKDFDTWQTKNHAEEKLKALERILVLKQKKVKLYLSYFA